MKYIADNTLNIRFESTQKQCKDGLWRMARPICTCNFFTKAKHAILVLRGKADILVWMSDN